MYCLENGRLHLTVHDPSDGFYQGTRFDHGGVLDSLLYGEQEMCGRWFERYHPCLHDAVCGPAEEFTPVGYGEGACFLKIGVGLLRADDAPYDRFKLYAVEDPGEWTVRQQGTSISLVHRLSGCYEYSKTLLLGGNGSFEIRHLLKAFRPLEGQVYNHNFFTLGKMEVGPRRQLDFPFHPAGKWRDLYDSVAFCEGGIRFSRSLEAGETVYCGDIHEAGKEGMPYSLSLSEGKTVVRISGDVPVTHTVFWANHRVACLEPYNHFSASDGCPFSWNLRYHFFQTH